MKKTAARMVCLALCAALCLTIPAGCAEEPAASQSGTRYLFDTVITVTVYDFYTDRYYRQTGRERPDLEAALAGALDLCEHYDDLFSRTKAGSDVSRINEAAGQPVEEDPVPAVFTWPVKGEILSGFSLEVLAYDETMGDWRTHSGVDIAASVGTNVLAISAGTVQGVYDDDLMGTCVVVDHGDGLTSTYCNLSAKPTVSEGDTVSTGTVLGVVGETAIAESSRPSHLHLEMAQDGKAVDPVSYLPQR